MKNLITTIALSILMATATNAQIKKPTVKVNTSDIKTNTTLQGVKINDLSRLITIEDFKKLNIPVQQITKEQLTKKPTQTWKINATQLYNGHLRFGYFNGYLSNDEFIVKSSNIRGSTTPDGIEHRIAREWNLDDLLPTFPLGISFRVAGDVEYRLKLKGGGSSDIFVLQNGSLLSRMSSISSQGDYSYVFKPEKSEEITLQFTSRIVEHTHSPDNWGVIKVTEIVIDRIN